MIEAWLGSPVATSHVLLDRVDGRTLNHAYVETTMEIARSTLRTHQNKVLGHGRRSRAVTITLSGQEELMHAVRSFFALLYMTLESLFPCSCFRPGEEDLRVLNRYTTRHLWIPRSLHRRICLPVPNLESCCT